MAPCGPAGTSTPWASTGVVSSGPPGFRVQASAAAERSGRVGRWALAASPVPQPPAAVAMMSAARTPIEPHTNRVRIPFAVTGPPLGAAETAIRSAAIRKL
jgi:hypothetical protein